MVKQKKIISLILSVIMLFSIVSVADFSAFAQDDVLSYLTYEINGNEVTITDCDNSISGEVIIPDTIEGYPVTKIDSLSFTFCSEITSITISENVTSIDIEALPIWGELKEIHVDSGNDYYSSDASGVLFNKDKTVLVQYPSAKENTSYNIPNGVETVGYAALVYSNNLAEITMPDSLKTINDWAFGCCDGLTSIVIGKNVETVGKSAFQECDNLRQVTFSDKVKAIGDSAFFLSPVEEIVIPNSVTSIGDRAFVCAFSSVTIPKSVKSIGEYSFGFEFFPFTEDGSVFVKNEDYVITGVKGTAAEKYAIENDITFEVLAGFDHEHSFGVIENVNSTCTQGGYIVYLCSECDYQEISDIEPLGHDYSEKIIDNKHLVSAATVSKKAVYKYDCSRCNSIGNKTFEYGEKLNIYNFGEETYNFYNFVKHGSCMEGGHCFGMSITSAAFYLKKLDITKVGGKYPKVNGLKKNADIIKLVCYYQGAQGDASNKAIVAGGSWYLNKCFKINDDWKAVVNYVKDHDYDNKGNLQVSFRTASAGHAVNFLYYKKVNGQDRIYIYDSNNPSTETYLYKDSNGKIRQGGGKPTYTAEIKCVALRDVNKYFKYMGEFDKRIAYYAYKDTVMIEGATEYYMDCGTEEQMIMYEMPEGQTTVKVIPLVDNATFMHMDKTYTFGSVDENTYVEFTIPESDENEVKFKVLNDEDFKCYDRYYDNKEECECNCHNENVFIKFINKIVYLLCQIFGMTEYRYCDCGDAHW